MVRSGFKLRHFESILTQYGKLPVFNAKDSISGENRNTLIPLHRRGTWSTMRKQLLSVSGLYLQIFRPHFWVMENTEESHPQTALSSGNSSRSCLFFSPTLCQDRYWLSLLTHTYHIALNFDPITQFLSIHSLLIQNPIGYTKGHSHWPQSRSSVEPQDS